jgi:hypothetical protein
MSVPAAYEDFIQSTNNWVDSIQVEEYYIFMPLELEVRDRKRTIGA